MKRVRRAVLHACVAALALLSSACTTYYDARFGPSPMEVKLEDAATPAVLGRALVTVRGIRRPADGQPAKFELLMRVENLGTAPFQIETESFELVTSSLQPLGAPVVAPLPLPPLAPGTMTNFEVDFPVPSGHSIGEYDLSGLVLRWSTLAGEQRLTTSLCFQRLVYPLYYGYYHDPFWPYGCWHVNAGVGAFYAY